MKLKFTERGANRVRMLDNWWHDNRPEAPELFKKELEAAKVELLSNPHLGRPYKKIRGRLFRKYLLEGCGEWLYYRVLEDEELIVVHTIWGSLLGSEPEID
ncbi:MAG: type II toxin-antitoxin system RelE/ParE family toxin [Polyangiaceae bacterium]|nr:type II toxin-antitoxin system RelE/ParE family toxin [Polyangiaceae bacterium]